MEKDTIDKVKEMAGEIFVRGETYRSHMNHDGFKSPQHQEMAETLRKRYQETIADQYRNLSPRGQEEYFAHLKKRWDSEYK